MTSASTSPAKRFLRSLVLAMALSSLALVLPARLASGGELYSEGGGSDEYGNDAFWRISSMAELLSASTSPACDTLRTRVFVSPAEAHSDWERSASTLYCYQYTLRNLGTTRIKVSLPGADVIRSPLHRVMQDFSIEIDPQSTAALVFVAGSNPREAFSPLDIAIWDPSSERWGFIRSGPVSLYLPSRPNLIGVASVAATR